MDLYTLCCGSDGRGVGAACCPINRPLVGWVIGRNPRTQRLMPKLAQGDNLGMRTAQNHLK
jgi:hypothetical protein